MAVSNQPGSDQPGSNQAGPYQQADRATQAVIAGVTELLPTLRQRAQEAEDGRVVPAESVKALEETGFFRLLRRDQVTGTGQAIRAVDLLFENSGGRALKLGTPIQRFWRDAHAGRVHAINDPERALSMFGRGEFGHDVPPDAMF